MKKLSFISLSFLLFVLAGCSKDWLEEYTTDPARPSDVSVQVLLPSAQISFGMAQGDAVARLTSIFMQQMTGTDRQSLAHNRYAQIGEADFDQVWSDNGYAGGLYDLKIIIDKTEATSPNYAGVAKVMTAMYLGHFTDIWGKIPYSDAMKGADGLNPTYDSQEQIYAQIMTLLDEAIVNMAATTSAIKPGAEDLVYAGSLSKWTKLAHSLKARYMNHLSKKPGYNPAGILAEVAAGLASNADDARITFQVSPNANPWYQFNTQRAGYISQFGTMYSMMEGKNDPRISLYRSADSSEMPAYGSETSPLNLMTYAELKFIEAEVRQRQSSGAGAALRDAVDANMSSLGVSSGAATTYLNGLSANPTLEQVMNEKYVAMFTHVEAWTDWRRTNFPALTVYPGAQFTEIPRRLPYPQNERLYNKNFIDLQGADGFLQRLWWDQ
ncbi:MAG: hypothetical protein RLZZ335_461 [Bacteroidota bacterium]|jgi:hypothetical protein